MDVIKAMKNLERIVKGCQNGDAVSQRELYEIYSPRFYALCKRYMRNPETAEDVLVEGFVTIYQNIDSFRGDGNFEAWMHRIFINRCINELRKEAVRRTSPLEEVDHPSSVPNMAMQMDVKRALEESMSHLSEEECTIFNLVVVDEYTLKDASELLETPIGTLKSRFYKARSIMQHQMDIKLGKNYR